MLTTKDFARIPPPDMDTTLRIRVTRLFYYKGKPQTVDKELDYPYALALEAIQMGKAERVVVAPPKPVSEPTPTPKAHGKKAKD